MRIVSWNLGHQTQERRLKPRLQEALALLVPDVLVLNEYVHGPSRDLFVEALRGQSLANLLVSERVGKNNQILIASCVAMRRGDLDGPPSADGGGESNFLHVVIPEYSLEIVGLRVPAYERRDELGAYWDGLARLMVSAEDRAIVFIGDFNADPDSTKSVGSKQLASLRGRGWNVPSPSGAHSFKSGARIDHIAASKTVAALRAKYVDRIGAIKLCGAAAEAISDHAPIVVDLEINATVADFPPTPS